MSSHFLVIGELNVLGLRERPVGKPVIEGVQVRAGPIAISVGIRVGTFGANGKKAVRPIRRRFPGINLTRYVRNDIAGLGSRANGSVVRINSPDSVDEPIGVGEVKARIKPQGHERGGCVDQGCAAENAQ
jgi:hypothetical protein